MTKAEFIIDLGEQLTAESGAAMVQFTGGYVGILFHGPDIARNFWRIRCPCGVEVSYAVNELPAFDTPHPCGDPKHWTVRWTA